MHRGLTLIAVIAALTMCQASFGDTGRAVLESRTASSDEDDVTPAPAALLFAVQVRTGPNWDHSIAADQQAFFREHSANLGRLRAAGRIVMGARYADIGLLVFSAASAAEVTAAMESDPSIAAGTFIFDVHPMQVFYPGTVAAD